MAQYKLANIKGKWQFVKLTDQEEKEVETRHRAKCKRILQESIIDVESVLSTYFNFRDQAFRDMIKALSVQVFERRTPHLTAEYIKEIDKQLAKLESQ